MNVCFLVVYNMDFEYLFMMCFNGILVVEVMFSGGRILGIFLVMELEGWNWEDVCYMVDMVIYMNWLVCMS